MNDIHIYRSAKLYIDQYGADASKHAAMQAEAMMRVGDLEGYGVWMQIGRAIEELQAKEGGAKR